MARYVCLLFFSLVACSQAETETLAKACKEVCMIIGDFLKEYDGEDPIIHEWLNSNGHLDSKWDCYYMIKVAQNFVEDMEKWRKEKSMEEMKEIGERMKKTMQEMGEPMANAIVENVSDPCVNKWEDIKNQVI